MSGKRRKIIQSAFYFHNSRRRKKHISNPNGTRVGNMFRAFKKGFMLAQRRQTC